MPGPIIPKKPAVRDTFQKTRVIDSIFAGGRLAVTPDEQLLLTTLDDEVVVSNLSTGAVERRLQPNARSVTCVAVAPSGAHALVATQSGLLQLYALPGGELRHSWRAHQAPVLAAAFDASSTLLATGSADSTVRVWDVAGGFCTHHLRGHGGVVTALAFAPAAAQRLELASASEDCTVRVWDLAAKTCKAVLQTHTSVVRGLAYSADGRALVSGGRDSVVALWDAAAEFALVRAVPVFEQVEACGVCGGAGLAPLVYFAGSRGAVAILDAGSGDIVRRQAAAENRGDEAHVIMDVLFLGLSQTLLAATAEQNLHFLRLDTLETVRQIAGHHDEVLDVCFVGGLVPTLENSDVTAEERFLAVATNSTAVRLLDTQSPECRLLEAHSGAVLALARSSDGRLLASGGKDAQVVVWRIDAAVDAATGRVAQLGGSVAALALGHTASVCAVAWAATLPGSNGPAFLVSAGQDRTVKIWDTASVSTGASQKLAATTTFLAHAKEINDVAVAPTNALLATASQDKTAKIWHVETGQLAVELRGHRRGVWSVAFSSVDKVVATGSGDGTARLWSLKDGTCLKTFEGHAGSVLRVTFYNAGLQLLTGGSDGLAKVWSVKTTECVATLDEHEDRVWAVAVAGATEQPLRTPRGLRADPAAATALVTGGADGRIALWRDTTAAAREQAARDAEEQVRQDQLLQNHWRAGAFREAISLALANGRPGALGALLRQMLERRDLARAGVDYPCGAGLVDDGRLALGQAAAAAAARAAVEDELAALRGDDFARVLGHVQAWNTQRRHVDVAQWVLSVLTRRVPLAAWAAVPNAGDVLAALVPYTEKHYRHSEQALTQSFLADLTLEFMDVFAPGVSSGGSFGEPLPGDAKISIADAVASLSQNA